MEALVAEYSGPGRMLYVSFGVFFADLEAPSLLLRCCSLSPGPLHPSHSQGHADQGVAQKFQMPSLQQGGTRWRPARKEVRESVVYWY